MLRGKKIPVNVFYAAKIRRPLSNDVPELLFHFGNYLIAGDLVSVSPTGMSVSRLCRLDSVSSRVARRFSTTSRGLEMTLGMTWSISSRGDWAIRRTRLTHLTPARCSALSFLFLRFAIVFFWHFTAEEKDSVKRGTKCCNSRIFHERNAKKKV